MLSLEKCKQLLNEKDEQFTDEEIILLRDYFTVWVDIAITNITKEENYDEFQK